MTTKATPPSNTAPKRPAPRPGLRLRPARYVPLSPEQEREAIAALARLLALVREGSQDSQDPGPAAEP